MYKPGQIIKKFTTKKDHTAIIRVIKPADLKSLFIFANSLIDEDTFVQLSGKKMTLNEEAAYFKKSLKQVKIGKKIHLVAIVDGQFAGSCETRIFEKRKSHAGEVGISLLAAYRNEGIGAVMLQTLIEMSKKQGLRLLTLNCFKNNTQAIHVYEKMGFKNAGCIPGMLFYKGKYVDEVIMYLPL